MSQVPNVAYFSMEVALEPDLPTYSGGLGVLAGDTLRSCADLGLAVTAVTLIHRKGYFRQHIEADGEQREEPAVWRPEDRLTPLDPRVEVSISGRPVQVRAWRYRITGATGATLDVHLLDTDLPENDAADRAITDLLYGGNDAYRLAQEVVLGVGGVRMLDALGLAPAGCHHLNEGHAALAVAELLARKDDGPEALQQVRDRCVFTTHTPVPAGHDRFSAALVRKILSPELRASLRRLGMRGELNMTELALEGSRFVNGVARRHGEVSRGMFPRWPVRSITNGVHPGTWASPSFQALFDRHVPEWRSDPLSLRGITAVDPAEIADAHRLAKRALLDFVHGETGIDLEAGTLTLGFARRKTAYKRALLLMREPERLARIAAEVGPLQILFAGKAHPNDAEGRAILRTIHQATRSAPDGVRIVLLPDYGMTLGGLLTAGCDVWLNTPIPPLEASGTSGMKAALNGVPSLSILDGWWVEGCVEGVTGWAIGNDGEGEELSADDRDALHADALYGKLQDVVVPTFYDEPDRFNAISQQAIALNGSFFHSHRMALQYHFEAYGGGPPPTGPGVRTG